jgi:hypothetical protein
MPGSSFDQNVVRVGLANDEVRYSSDAVAGGRVFFWVDESGHTGANLFDEDQPMLYYGVLHSAVNLDVVAEPVVSAYRRRFGVSRLHAAELGNQRLPGLVASLAEFRKRLDVRFDMYRVAKPDHAIICFFDQVFDHGVNPAITWSAYWTPLRYLLLVKLARLFTDDLAKTAWDARISINVARAHAGLVEVCEGLRGRIDLLPDARSRQLIGDTLKWAAANPSEINYNVADKEAVLQITPNVIGFQSVMHGIASRIQKAKRQASRILVDQQLQFNRAQKTLADFYSAARAIPWATGPGLPVMDLKHMPTVQIEVGSSSNSAGLELTDIYLWVFKRYFEGKELAPDLLELLRGQMHRGRTDEISLNAIAKRWGAHFESLPELDQMSPEQLKRGKELLQFDEDRRLKAIRGEV